ncbi:Uncharacterised protein [Chlamydia trachomatis]|nr:Uncharacterised protein [Chlamydia trachomatis]
MNDSARPSVMNRAKDSFCTEIKLGSSIVGAILEKLTRSRCFGLSPWIDFNLGTRLFLLQKGGRRQLSQRNNLAKVMTVVNIRP